MSETNRARAPPKPSTPTPHAPGVAEGVAAGPTPDGPPGGSEAGAAAGAAGPLAKKRLPRPAAAWVRVVDDWGDGLVRDAGVACLVVVGGEFLLFGMAASDVMWTEETVGVIVFLALGGAVLFPAALFLLGAGLLRHLRLARYRAAFWPQLNLVRDWARRGVLEPREYEWASGRLQALASGRFGGERLRFAAHVLFPYVLVALAGLAVLVLGLVIALPEVRRDPGGDAAAFFPVLIATLGIVAGVFVAGVVLYLPLRGLARSETAAAFAEVERWFEDQAQRRGQAPGGPAAARVANKGGPGRPGVKKRRARPPRPR